ncbi:MAG: hypothetical protein KF903_05245 [Dokdonella sp.]|uniref:DUF6445 family protein n=1 Tax=Dokdonella sp. TaxID=2291710 RepID=UPI0025BAA8A0|nr:DUF6445 family protein [Dokdonella sp.]MBX3700389.1 hypothetical protein [Dokdonella sp.]MCW5579151.1 hypothetical protein [Dokdonella sp.]
MPTSIVIVDDFLSDPHALRAAALRLTYPPQNGAFPGRNSLERIQLDGLVPQVSRILGEPLRLLDPPQSHAKCRITLAGDVGRARVHVDQSHWSGILYLTLPEHCRGGTDFFRHKRSNSERGPTSLEELHAMGYASMQELHQDIIERDSNDTAAWELTMSASMRFNRLVLLRPWFWHSAGEGFGDSLANGRLVYLMFFGSAA